MSDTRLDHARDVLRLEADAVRAQIDQLGAPFLAACDLLLATRGHIIVTGLGKSGHIGEKIAATLASTGTPAFFVHAAEAGHGDLGMITGDDTILAISYSGESQEILMMLPIVRALGVKTIALTGRPQSSMAQQADLQPGELVWTGGDVHLYNNHLAQAETQLAREPYPLPTLALRHAPSIDAYQYSDITLQNYQSHPAIPAPVAV